MNEKNLRYGQFIRSKRVADPRELTLKDVAEELGVSVSFVSDVEQGRRKPYDEERIVKLIELLRFTEEDIALMYELASREYAQEQMVPGNAQRCLTVADLAKVAFL